MRDKQEALQHFIACKSSLSLSLIYVQAKGDDVRVRGVRKSTVAEKAYAMIGVIVLRCVTMWVSFCRREALVITLPHIYIIQK